MRPSALTVFALALAAAAAASDPKPTLADLPPAMRELPTRQQGDVGEPDAPFSHWCVRQPGTFHVRLVAIESQPQRILVFSFIQRRKVKFSYTAFCHSSVSSASNKSGCSRLSLHQIKDHPRLCA